MIPPKGLSTAFGASGESEAYDIPEGYMVIEGDIVVPLDFRESLGRRGCFAPNLWPNGIVPYEFDAGVTASHQTAMLNAMAEWEAVAAVDFRARSGEANYIYIKDDPGNWSFVGMQVGNQEIGIFNWGYRFIMAHELGHALGLWHEQSRTDRDVFIQVITGNIEPGKEHNFDIVPTSTTHGDYDFDSVMHYGQCSFSACAGCPDSAAPGCTDGGVTILVLPPWDDDWQDNIGQRDHLSSGDQATMAFLYGNVNTAPVGSNPQVSPGLAPYDTPFDYSIYVSDPEDDSVDVVLEVYDPSSGSWENQGTRTVNGSGTALWEDRTPFESNDAGMTAQYRFHYDDSHNTGTWGPYSGPTLDDAGVPSVSSGTVDPASGSDHTIFSFRVTYTDPTGQAPIQAKVGLSREGADWEEFPMSPGQGPYTTGKEHQYTTQLLIGSYRHRFHFETADGHHIYWPTVEGNPDPTVGQPDALEVTFWCDFPPGQSSYEIGDRPSFYWEVREPDGQLCCDCQLRLYNTPPNPHVCPVPIDCGRWEYGTEDAPASNWEFGCGCYSFLAVATHPDYATGQARLEFETCPCPSVPPVEIESMAVSPGVFVAGVMPASISHSINLDARETIWLENEAGQVIRTLVDGVDRPAAPPTHDDLWDGRDDSGNLVPAGQYNVVIEALHVHVNPNPTMDRFVPFGSGSGDVTRVRGMAYTSNLLYILSNDDASNIKVVAYRPDLSFFDEWTVPCHSQITEAVANPIGMTADVDGLLYILSYKDVGPMAFRVNAWEADPDPAVSGLTFQCELAGSLTWMPYEPDLAPITFDPFSEQIIFWGEQWQTPDDKAFVLDTSCGPFVCNLDPSPGTNQYMGASGMAVDSDGNVWVATAGTLRAFEHSAEHCGPVIREVPSYVNMRLATRYGRLMYWMIGSELQIHDLRGQYLTAICLDSAGFVGEEERFLVTTEGEYVFAVGRPCGQGGSDLRLVRVQDFNSAAVRTEPISIVRGMITAYSPNGGECWLAGSTHSITWGTLGSVDNVTIRLYEGPDPGDEVPGFSPVEGNIQNTGTYLWDIPPELPPGQLYRIRTEDSADSSIYDLSDDPFTILLPKGDCDDDGDVDLQDFFAFQVCYTGPNGTINPGCECTDFDGDGDTDLQDFVGFHVAYTGPS